MSGLSWFILGVVSTIIVFLLRRSSGKTTTSSAPTYQITFAELAANLWEQERVPQEHPTQSQPTPNTTQTPATNNTPIQQHHQPPTPPLATQIVSEPLIPWFELQPYLQEINKKINKVANGRDVETISFGETLYCTKPVLYQAIKRLAPDPALCGDWNKREITAALIRQLHREQCIDEAQFSPDHCYTLTRGSETFQLHCIPLKLSAFGITAIAAEQRKAGMLLDITHITKGKHDGNHSPITP